MEKLRICESMENKKESEQNSPTVQNPHDSFFRQLFIDKLKVESYLKGGLPKDIAEKINYESLVLDKDSYVDDELKNHFADVVYQCKYDEGSPVKIALLFEHKSTVPEFPHIQLLRYMLRIWETQIKNKEPLQPIIPIIIYHGVEKWKIKGFESNFEKGVIHSDLISFTPKFEYWLTNLESSSSSTITNAYKLASLRMAFLLMKHIRSANILEEIPFIFAGAEEYFQSEAGKRYFDSLFLYILYATDKTQHEIKEVMNDVFTYDPPLGSGAWQLQQESIEKGIEQGIEQGIQQGTYKIVVNMISKEFTNIDISNATDLSVEKVDQIRKAQV